MNDPRTHGSPLDRFLAALLVPAAVLVLALTSAAVIEAVNYSWNDIRLAPSAALLLGLSIYPEPGGAPINGHIYGPVGPLLYLPAALLPTPSAGMRAGALIAFLAALTPLVLLVLAASRWRRDARTWAALGIAALYLFTTKGMSRMAFSLHVDGPAVALGALACWCLYDRRRRDRVGWLTASALAAILSVGVKQVMLPVVVAVPLFLWLAEGGRVATRYVGLLVIVGLGAVGLTALFVDPRDMVYYALIVPSEHDYMFGFGRVVRDMAPRSAPPLLVVAALGTLAWLDPDRAPGVRGWLRDNPWTLLLLVAILCLPTSMLGRAKLGGAIQVLNFTIYPLFAAALAALVELGQRPRDVLGTPARRVAGLVLAIILGALIVDTAPRALRLPALLRDLPNEATAAAYRFVGEHPQQVWIPYRPLITLKVDGRFYHTLDPILTTQLLEHAAGDDLAATVRDDAFMQAHLPADLRYVLYPVDGETPLTWAGQRPGWEWYVEQYLPEFSEVRDIGLPGWRALVRPDSAP